MASPGSTAEAERRWFRRRFGLAQGFLVLLLIVAGGVTGLVLYEMRTSHFQARFIVPLALEADWSVEEGPASSLVLPGPGPYDLRLGYHQLADRVGRAEARGFSISAQARPSVRFRQLVEERDLFPPFPEKSRAGLLLEDRRGRTLYDHHRPELVYPTFESIPPIIWQTLLFVENRTALDTSSPNRNPAVEWGRLARSTVGLGMRYLGRDGRVAGASTLATQIEKFRHAPEGFTETPRDKLLQMASASFRVYLHGEVTLPARQRVVLDYLNSVPLAAMRGEGEILGLTEGLHTWFGADVVEANRLLSTVPVRRVGRIPDPVELFGDDAVPAFVYWREGFPRPEESWADRATRVLSPVSVLLGTEPDDPSLPSTGDVDEADPEVGGASWRDDVPMPPAGPSTAQEWREAALAYRQVLSLLLAQRRPSYHLTDPEGREALHRLTDRHLRLLRAEGVIPAELADVALQIRPELQTLPPPRPPVPFVERKAVNAVRTQLLGLLGIPLLYELDRADLSVRTTIDGPAQEATTDFLVRLQDPAFVRERGFTAPRLIEGNDPTKVVYSVLLYERTDRGNEVRVQVDNLDAPFNLNESARLELGSTAKLRTLATYLEIIADVHGQMSGLSPAELRAFPVAPSDRLGSWVRGQLLGNPDLELYPLLQRAMQRGYSANPSETFVTGGGVQTFSNFDRTYDQQVVSALVGFRHSINLVFVRMMREIVSHYTYRMPGSTAHVLGEVDSPLRQEYLERFADREGIEFLDRFIPKYRGQDRQGVLEALLRDRRLSPQRVAWAYRSAVPDASPEEFESTLRRHDPEAAFSEATIDDLYRRADPGPHELADLGYLASIHPLEIWVARHVLENPGATRAELIAASRDERQEVYRWLFRTRFRDAQDRRIRSLLEVEAFTQVLDRWQRLGYPFQNIVPSLGTSIGSSGDRPASLSELVGVILNDGVRVPTHRVETLHFASETPYETRLERGLAREERVMEPEVARVLREAMIDVVEAGTGFRIRGAVRDADGNELPIGAKTGTGDNRYRVFAPGGRLLESRSVNRTSTLVFFVGDRFYGVITAYVPGEDAARYRFTAALPGQILRELGPIIETLLEPEVGGGEPGAQGAANSGASEPARSTTGIGGG